MRDKKVGRVAAYGMLIALAMIFSYVESQVPVFLAVPGMKLGLTNIVVLFALYCIGTQSAVGVNVLRVVLTGVMFGNGFSLYYSLAGALLSGIVMIGLEKVGKFHLVTVSIAGGIAHNVGQILVAYVFLRSKALLGYLVVLWFTGLAAGAVIGVIGAVVCGRLQKVVGLYLT
ncbi:MAG: Gx transporter family protein [Lachnospiraceae bacterium]|nr:Gx transporter family protein [Lachnospiraceae bacterium]